jgi:steroid delta-isomerase-like uncharacterized protein
MRRAARSSPGMAADARTPEELDSLLEDAFVLGDDHALGLLFEEHAVLADDQAETHGADQLPLWAAATRHRQLTYLANPARVLQARDIALVLTERGASVMRRSADGSWRYLILVPSLVPIRTHRSSTRRSEMTTDNKALVRREVEEALSGGNLGVLDELIADEYVSYDPAAPEPIRGREAYKALIAGYRQGLGEALAVRIDDQIAEGDKVVTRWTARGRHDGELFGIPPTGRQVEITGISIERLEGGRIVEDWVNWDALGLMRQLKVIPDSEELQPAGAAAV